MRPDNSFNEPDDISAELWHTNECALIAAICEQSPRSLIFVGGPNWKNHINPLIDGEMPDFTAPNLIYDFHGYPFSYAAKEWPAWIEKQISWSQQHGKATSISEWGGNRNPESYNEQMASFCRAHRVALAYYCIRDLYRLGDGNPELTEAGKRARRTYSDWKNE